MSVTSPARLRASFFRHPFLLAAAAGIAVLAGAVWIMSGSRGRWISSGGPYVEFEIRLPAGILLPPDRNIEVTLWSNEIGRDCHGIEVRRASDPPEIVGKCSLIGHSSESALSVRFSHFAEGFWKVPIRGPTSSDPVFGPWQRIDFTWAPVGKRVVSSLPHGEYYFRYLVRP
jgi:hypothetical protein